ncbi:MAG: pirin family protein [candidate division Zixibacteria bacterium]|nr:pirin family protein [candidate division Zixibacteria bacterium]
MIKLRPANERGHADHGWLNTWHTFSFNTYYDENYMGFRALRVINDDRVQPGKGFGTHPHQDMEIVTYILDGMLQHKDSMGNGSIIKPGDVQRMSAGKGILHSEFNPSQDDPVHLLQVWITPDRKGVDPTYDQKHFSREEKLGTLRLIASPDGRDGSVSMRQDASIYATLIENGTELSLPIGTGRHVWVHVARGDVKLGEHKLTGGDGAAISGEASLTLTGLGAAEVLLFDLA